MLQTSDDRTLVSAALGGDREAFRRLVDRHYDTIYRVAYRFVGSAADAEDIAQEVLIALAKRLSQFQNRSRFSTWLISIAVNQCRDFLRRRKSAEGVLSAYSVLSGFAAADQADDERRRNWLHDAMAGLEPDLRETVILVVAEELSHAEAAEILGCAESTVSWRMHVVRKLLRARWDDDHDA